MAWAAVIGGGVALVGGAMSAKAQKDAAKSASAGAQFQPYAVQGAGANVGFEIDPVTGNRLVDVQLGNQEQDINASLLTGAGQNFMFGGPNADLAETIRKQSGGTTTSAFAAQDANLRNTMTPQQALVAAGQFDRLGAQQNFFGQKGLNAAFSGPTAEGLTEEAQQRGLGLLDSASATSFNDLAAQRLTALRAAARPGEQRAVDSKFNNLFASGRLGTEGGARGIEALAQAQEQADIGRVINSQDFANSQQNQERAFMQNQQQLGANLVGQAFGGISQDQSRAANLGQLGASQLGQVGATTAAQLGAFQTADQATLSAGQQRLQNAQQMFGFGDALTQTSLDRGAQQLGLSQTINQQALDSARLGASVGQAQATAGANAGQLSMMGAGSNVGSALQGFGTGIANSDLDLGKAAGSVGNFFGGLFGGDG